jgi:SAM-dependent methyltransferase
VSKKSIVTRDSNRALAAALWKIYRRPNRPEPWAHGGNLPWYEPAFSERMLREHLDDAHGAASRQAAERKLQLDWLWTRLKLQPGDHLFDVTCGPGLYAVELARRGCRVTGLDFSPAAIAYARDLARSEGVAARCDFVEQDVRQMGESFQGAGFDAAILLYGQLAVFPKAEARSLLGHIAAALSPGGRLALELLDQERVDKSNSSWWFTDNAGLWGDAPFLHLGERFWDEAEQMSLERYHILHLQTGEMNEIVLCDQTYSTAEMSGLLQQAGFQSVEVYPAWDGLPLYDAGEWVVYVAGK